MFNGLAEPQFSGVVYMCGAFGAFTGLFCLFITGGFPKEEEKDDKEKSKQNKK